MSTVPNTTDATIPATGGDGPPAPPITVARGTEIGRYIVLGEIGHGSMGVVLAAYDADLDRKVAIKLAFEPLRGAADRRARMLREAQALAKIAHTNVIAIHDVGTFDDRMYLAMEFVEGVSLRAWCSAAPRTQAQLLEVFTAAGRGLEAAHQAGVVHRDFKPDNVIIAEERRDGAEFLHVRVVDFGLARPQEVVTSDDARDTPIAGTPAYMAPEQHGTRGIDTRVDQFAFCVALFEALWGQRPFRGDSPSVIAAAALTGQIAVPETPRVAARIRRVVLRGLSARPDERYASMAELIAALDAARRPRWRGPLAATTAALVAGAAWWATRDPPPQPCGPGMDRVSAIWPRGSDPVRVATGEFSPGFAAAAGDRLHEGIDAYAKAWAEVHDRSCAAQANAADIANASARGECVEDRFAALSGLVGFLGNHEIGADRIDDLLANLPPIALCEGEDVTEWSWDPTPTDPQLAAEVRALRARIRDITVARQSGAAPDGDAAIRAVVEEARATGFDPIIARALRELAMQEEELGEPTDALAHLDDALEHALIGRSDLLAAAVTIAIVRALRDVPERAPDAEHWARLGMALLQRGGGDDGLEGDLEMSRGNILLRQARPSEALPHFLAAQRAYAARQPGGSEPEAGAIHNQGLAHLQLGDTAGARADLEAAERMLETSVGRNHPTMIAFLQTDAAIASKEGRAVEAMATTRDALDRAVSVWGDTGVRVRMLAHNLGYFEASRGHIDAANANLLRARAAIPAGDLSSVLSCDLLEIAIQEVAGDIDGAMATLERVLASVDRNRIPASEILRLDLMHVEVLIAAGRGAEALKLADAMWSLGEAVVGLRFMLATFGVQAATDTHATQEATMWLARLELLTPNNPEDEANLVLSRAVVGAQRDAATLARVRAARDRLAALRFEGYPLVKRIDAWLAGGSATLPR